MFGCYAVTIVDLSFPLNLDLSQSPFNRLYIVFLFPTMAYIHTNTHYWLIWLISHQCYPYTYMQCDLHLNLHDRDLDSPCETINYVWRSTNWSMLYVTLPVYMTGPFIVLFYSRIAPPPQFHIRGLCQNHMPLVVCLLGRHNARILYSWFCDHYMLTPAYTSRD